MRQLILQGLAAAMALPIAASAQAGGGEQPGSTRPPDAHVLRPPRGDVVEVREGVIFPNYDAARPAGDAAPVRRGTPAPAESLKEKPGKPRPPGR